MAQSLATVRAHYDQVDIETSRTVKHLLGRIAADHQRFVAHRCRNPFPPEACKLLLPFLFKVWIWIQRYRLESRRAGGQRRDTKQVQLRIVLLDYFHCEVEGCQRMLRKIDRAKDLTKELNHCCLHSYPDALLLCRFLEFFRRRPTMARW